MPRVESKPCKGAAASLCFTRMSHGIEATEPERIVLYDGTCGFCQRSVQWILAADRDKRFRFAPLQGPTGAAVRGRHPELPIDPDSVVYVDRSGAVEHAYARADAIFRIIELLPDVPTWMRLAARLPRWLTNPGYRIVARSRHSISKAMGACPIPTSEERARFLP
jgi:predicted DCC family thiol-disulfide oxidoreductase YuxK